MKLCLVILTLLAGCGGGAVCGNGSVEEGEQCDDGNNADGDSCSSKCMALETVDTYIHFTPFIANQFSDFKGDNCSGLEIEQVEITLAGPKPSTQKVDCGLIQLKLSSLPKGAYTVTAKAFGAGGTAITRGMAHAAFTVADKTQDVNIDWSYEDFIKSYTGIFYFHVLWGGADTCAGATPPVARQRFRLEHNGVAVSSSVMTGEPLNGTATGACVDGKEALAQSAPGIPWGPAKFTVTGESAGGSELFKKTFDTFVGAGIVNAPIVYDVPSLLPDAGPADAGPTDGGI